MPKVTIAEILHYAADHCLTTDPSSIGVDSDDTETFSCCAIDQAVEKLIGKHSDYYRYSTERQNEIGAGLEAMGLNTFSCIEFDEFTYGTKRQDARYLWLKFAALIAEEQGI